MRTCKKCNQPKPEDRFATFRTRRGEERRRSVCWDCRNGWATEHAQELKEYRKKRNLELADERHLRARERREVARSYTDQIKAETPCADCGRKFPPVAMDFDHVRGAKTKNVSEMVSQAYRLDLIKEEIAKCDVVCACCHRIRTSILGQNMGCPVRQEHPA